MSFLVSVDVSISPMVKENVQRRNNIIHVVPGFREQNLLPDYVTSVCDEVDPH